MIPVEVAEITPEFLSDALGTPVETVEVLDASSGTTGRARVAVTYAAGVGSPSTVFVKLAPFDVRQRAFVRRGGIGANEAHLYRDLADELPVRIPGIRYAAVDDDGRYVTVMEDLTASGCTFPRPSDPAMPEHARSVIDGMARLHAKYWESDRFAGDLGWVPERAGFGKGGGKDPKSLAGAGHFVRQALDQFADDMAPAFRAVGTMYSERTAAVLDLWDEGERTLVHGDPHLGNLFLDGSVMGFLDWGMLSRSPGMRDVAYFCCNSIPQDVRNAIQTDLLDRYRARLGDQGVTLDADLIADQYRLFSVFSWVSTVSTAAVGSRWQPAPRAIAAMERTTAALEDLGTADYLADRLGAAR